MHAKEVQRLFDKQPFGLIGLGRLMAECPENICSDWWLGFKDGKIIRAHAFFDSIAFNDLWLRVKP